MEVYYDGLMAYNSNTTMGFASANLQLMTLEYDLFQFLPFNFCGDWVYDANYGCPEDGIYHFQIPYELPEADGINAWFATGWQGVSYIKIYRAEEATSALLAHCKLHFNTYVTDSQESSNWYTLPSAAQVTIVLFSILGALFLIVLCCACRTSGKQEPHPTDPDYTTNYKTMDGDAKTVSSRQDEESPENFERANKISDNFERANKISVRMGYNH